MSIVLGVAQFWRGAFQMCWVALPSVKLATMGAGRRYRVGWAKNRQVCPSIHLGVKAHLPLCVSARFSHFSWPYLFYQAGPDLWKSPYLVRWILRNTSSILKYSHMPNSSPSMVIKTQTLYILHMHMIHSMRYMDAEYYIRCIIHGSLEIFVALVARIFFSPRFDLPSGS